MHFIYLFILLQQDKTKSTSQERAGRMQLEIELSLRWVPLV